MFTEESALVSTWVRLVESGAFTKDQIPKLFNLRDVVCGILEAREQ